MHYLIIDDHLLFAGGLAGLLEQSLAPCTTTQVRSAEEAERFLGFRFDFLSFPESPTPSPPPSPPPPGSPGGPDGGFLSPPVEGL